MAVPAASGRVFLLALVVLAGVSCRDGGGVAAELSTKYYDRTCPGVQSVVRSVMAQTVAGEPRMGASILRLFFHDCFVNGCDGSVLLDDAPGLTGEKTAGPNLGSVRGFELIDAIKARVEATCRATVSCADILAIASRDAVVLLGGLAWTVKLGRKDARTASLAAANTNLPAPTANLGALLGSFAAKGFSARDMTALSGAHTVGRAQCQSFSGRVNGGDTDVNATFAAQLRQACAAAGGALAPLDTETPDRFDNGYFRELVLQRGVLHSDQELFNGGSQDAQVRKYAGNAGMFASDFARAMVKMGSLAPVAGTPLEVRINCRKPN